MLILWWWLFSIPLKMTLWFQESATFKVLYYRVICIISDINQKFFTFASLNIWELAEGHILMKRSFRARKIFSNCFWAERWHYKIHQGKNAKANTNFSSITIFWLTLLFLNQFIIRIIWKLQASIREPFPSWYFLCYLSKSKV